MCRKTILLPKPYCDGDLSKTTKGECDSANKTWTYPENSCQTLRLANSTCNGNGVCGDQGQCICYGRGTCSDSSKKTKQECDNVNGTWTYEDRR